MDQVDERAVSAVRDACKSAGVTLNRLSGMTGISYTTLKRRLSGHTSFRLDELVRIADALNIPFWQLLPDAKEARRAA